MMAARPYLALLSLALATYLGQSGALYTGVSGDETSSDSDSVSTRGYYIVYGDTDSQLAGRHLDELYSGNATSEGLARRDVWSPQITSPNSKTVWVAGTTVEVTWSVLPKVYAALLTLAGIRAILQGESPAQMERYSSGT